MRMLSIFSSDPRKMGTYTPMDEVKLPYNRAPRHTPALYSASSPRELFFLICCNTILLLVLFLDSLQLVLAEDIVERGSAEMLLH